MVMADRSRREGDQRAVRLIRVGEESALGQPSNCLSSGGNELIAPAQQSNALPPEVRAFLISKLAEMLVLDFQVNQYVSGPTVQSAGVLDHKPGAGKQEKRERRRAS